MPLNFQSQPAWEARPFDEGAPGIKFKQVSNTLF